MEAIISAVFEIVYLQARRRGDLRIAAMLPDITHLWLTPFLGNEQADAFIDAQLQSPATPQRARTERARTARREGGRA